MVTKTSRVAEQSELEPEMTEELDCDPPVVEDLDLHECIAALAYAKAEQRGFEPDHELEDWLEAERGLTE